MPIDINVKVSGLEGIALALEHVALAMGTYTETKYAGEIAKAEAYLEDHDREVEAARAAEPAPAPVDIEKVSAAAVALLDAGRRDELLALLADFNVQAMAQLPRDQLPAFADRLRAMGAPI